MTPLERFEIALEVREKKKGIALAYMDGIVKASAQACQDELEFLENRVSKFFLRDYFTEEVDEEFREDYEFVNNVEKRINQLKAVVEKAKGEGIL